ncbi:MAG: tRNA dihydrouridine synthase DusB [Armatimonadaceae bacterium]
MRIGTIDIENPVVLAPMAGVTSHPFRAICKQHGDVGLVVTELISSMAIHYKNQKTYGMFDWTESEQPSFCQLFGADPETMAEAARVVVDRGAVGVDINMGCWVPKVAKTGAGAALLKDLCQAEAVVKAVVDAVPEVPVTVKVRSGYTQGNLTAVKFARAAADIGAKAIAVHARYASQGFSGNADWNVIAQVKDAVGNAIPVIGNGDIETPDDALRMLRQTGCDGVMVGRAAMGNPWLLGQIRDAIANESLRREPTVEERVAVARQHASLQVDVQGEGVACRELRGLLGHYFRGVPGATRLRGTLAKESTLEGINRTLDEYLVWYQSHDQETLHSEAVAS